MRVLMLLAVAGCGSADTTLAEDDTTGDAVPDLPTVIVDGETGDPGLKSAHALAFAPAGHLVVGDGVRDRLMVLATGDTTWDPNAAAFARVRDLYAAAADALGVDAGDVEIRDIAVNPLSGRTYVAVDRLDRDAGHVLTVTPDGALTPLDLAASTHAVVPYDERDGAGSIVTDLVWTSDTVVAAVTEQAWTSSQVVTFSTPVSHRDASAVATTDTYHRVHGQWETFAPITTLFAYTDGDGVGWIGASYQCAPVVRFEVEALAAGGEVTGVTPYDYGGGREVLDFAVMGDGETADIYASVLNLGGTQVDAALFFADGKVDDAAPVAFDFGGAPDHAKAGSANRLDGAERIAPLGTDQLVVWTGSALNIVARP
ncbi:MAG: hypothetical protein ACI8PZ_006232 [Myxococcota bacterium]|jgi:hypothetical protein